MTSAEASAALLILANGPRDAGGGRERGESVTTPDRTKERTNELPHFSSCLGILQASRIPSTSLTLTLTEILGETQGGKGERERGREKERVGEGERDGVEEERRNRRYSERE